MKCPICNCRTHIEPVLTFAGAESERKCIICGRRYQLDPGPDGRALPIVPLPAPEPAGQLSPARCVNSDRHTPNKYRHATRTGEAWDDYTRWQELTVADKKAVIASIKAQFQERNITRIHIADRAKMSRSQVSEVLMGRTYGPVIREAIAQELGRPYLEVWGPDLSAAAPPAEEAAPASPPFQGEGQGGDGLSTSTRAILGILSTKHHLSQATQLLERTCQV